jgi:hypothetical protein
MEVLRDMNDNFSFGDIVRDSGSGGIGILEGIEIYKRQREQRVLVKLNKCKSIFVDAEDLILICKEDDRRDMNE